jgi:DNA-binding transcriptional LysR family regulator
MRIELHHLRAFLAVTDTLQFRAAAERLHITQPALSRIVKALEEEVGARLLARTTRSVELTEAGRVFAVQARLSLGHLERAVKLARLAQAGHTGNLRIAYMDFAINGVLPEIVRGFNRAYPDVHVDLVHLPSTAQQAALRERTIDFGFMIGPFTGEGIETKVFSTERMMALLPTKHPLAGRSKLALRDLANERFVLGAHESWEAFRVQFHAMCQRAGFVPVIAQEASTSDGIFGLVAANIGVSLYPECVRNIQRKGLKVISLTDRLMQLDLLACWLTESENPCSSLFAEYVRQSGRVGDKRHRST